MTSMSDERLAFLRRLGITEEDIMDPLSVNRGNEGHDKCAKNSVSDNVVSETSADDIFLKTSKAVFFDAKLPDPNEVLLTKGEMSQKVNMGNSVDRLSPEQLKEKGNRAFEEGRYREAVNWFTEAIEILLAAGNHQFKEHGRLNMNSDALFVSSFDANNPNTVLLAALFSNRSASYLQAAKQMGVNEAFENAIRDADRAVELRPAWFKGYSRQGDAFFKMKKYNQAAEAYEMALQLDPGNSNLLQSVQEARQRSAAEFRGRLQTRKKNTTMQNTGPEVASLSAAPVMVVAHNNITFNDVPSGGHEGGQEGTARKLWDDFKPKVEASFQQGDNENGQKGNARQLWDEFKPKVEASLQQRTGDDYRLEQLRLFREQKEREKNGLVSVDKNCRKNENSFLKGDGVEQTGSGGVDMSTKATFRKERRESIPSEFSSEAAAAYQQRLLEEFRRRKAQRS